MSNSTLTDRAVQAIYRVGFVAAQCWWFVRRPHHDGALVAIWARDELLLVRQSYQPLWTLPGGGVGRGEAPASAAARELGEEIGLTVSAAQLRSAGAILHFFRWRHDCVHLFELHVDAKLPCRLDGRELVKSRWLAAHDALSLPLAPHVRRYIVGKISGVRISEPQADLADVMGA